MKAISQSDTAGVVLLLELRGVGVCDLTLDCEVLQLVMASFLLLILLLGGGSINTSRLEEF